MKRRIVTITAVEDPATATMATTPEVAEAAITTRQEPVAKKAILCTTVPQRSNHEDTLIKFLDPRYDSAELLPNNFSPITDSALQILNFAKFTKEFLEVYLIFQ